MKRKKHLIPVLCLLSFVLCIHAAKGADNKFNKKEYLKAANAAFKEGSLFSATDLYLKILANDSTETSVLFNLAQSYYMVRDYDLASVYFKKAYAADATGHPTALYYQAITLKMQGRYNEALPLFKQFAKNYAGDDAKKMKKWAKTEIDGCNFAIKEAQPDPFVRLTHLGREVNSNYTDMSPSLRDDMLYYSSMRSDTVPYIMPGDKSGLKKEDVLLKLFVSKKTGDTTFTPAEKIKTWSKDGYHIANPDFSEDGNKFFYCLCEAGNLMEPPCSIYMSEYNGSDWSEGKPLNDEINLKGSTNTYPWYAKGANGSNDVLFFVSDRDGGKGGKDIWYSTVNKKGEFSAPRNAGSKINTDRDEITPFFDSKMHMLYFSSNGWISMGGFDIFKSQADASMKFNNTPENLGAPFNSPCDDNYYRYWTSPQEGYLVSNRPGIYSVRGKTCCADIFEYKYVKAIYLAVKGHVFDDATKEPLADAAVNLSMRSNNVSESDVVIASDSSKIIPPYLFNLKPEKLYKLSATRDGYFASSQTFNTTGITKSDTQTVDIYLKKLEKNKAYRLNNIYYDFDKADLRPESKATLDTLYNLLMENPTIIIELSSHTDIRGSAQYNINLSQRRAESCVNYLINEKGIPKERISAKGYGATKLLDDCSKYPECPMDQSGDCPCHQLNRRTEFKIIGELDGKLIYDNQE